MQTAYMVTISMPIYAFVSLQWMATGQSGLSGRSVLVPVVRATEPGSGPAVTLHLSMEADLVRGRQWRSSCAVSDLVRVSNQISLKTVRCMNRWYEEECISNLNWMSHAAVK